MQTGSSNGADILFNPPGCNPFRVPTSPSKHYFPSNLQQQHASAKDAILTPEKRHRFHIKDNESYAPLNYSICEEEEESYQDTIPEKLQPVSTLKTSDRWSSNQFIEEWPSSESQHILQHSSSHKSVTSEILQSRGSDHTADAISITDDQLLFQNTESLSTLQPKMSSTQNSVDASKNISMLINRFRYGKPMPPSERNRTSSASTGSSRIKPSSSVSKKSYAWQSKSSLLSKKQSLRDSHASSQGNVTTDSSTHDDSITQLQNRVEQILKDSTSSLNTQPSSGLSALYSPTQQFSSNDSKRSSTDKPSSSFNTSPSITSNKTGIDEPFSSINAVAPSVRTTPLLLDESSMLPKASFNLPPDPIVYGNGRRDIPFHPPPRPNPPLHDDILHQWRLRRKMEAARSARSNILLIDDSVGAPATLAPENHLRFEPAERPLVSSQPAVPHVASQPRGADFDIPKQMRSVGVSAVPMIAAETQTTPTASITSVENDSSSHGSSPPTSGVSIRKDADISLHKVTVINGRSNQRLVNKAVEAKPLSPVSVQSNHTSTDTWGDFSLHSRTNASSPISSKQREPKGRASEMSSEKAATSSPTTTVVKQVVGARLFDVSCTNSPAQTSISTTEPHESFVAELSDHTDVIQPTLEENSVKTTDNECVEANDEQRLSGSSSRNSLNNNPQVILEKLLDSIENEPDDFIDDPVLKSLREQRTKFLLELRSIDEKLKQLENTEKDS